MKYKYLVLDIDGTLTNNQKQITPHTLEVLIKAQQQGLKLVLASGRPTYGIVPLAEELRMGEFGGYILSFNGGKIIDLNGMQTIYATTLPQSSVPVLSELAKGSDTVILSYRDEYIITEQPEDKYAQHEIFLTKMKPQKVDDFVQAVDFAPDKCLIVGDPEKLIPLIDVVQSKFGGEINAFRSEPFFLEVVPQGIDKAESLKRLMAHVGGSIEEMVAVGDGFNDLSMIKLAGLGVAMENAQSELKEVADYITLSNENDGVAALVEKFILE